MLCMLEMLCGCIIPYKNNDGPNLYNPFLKHLQKDIVPINTEIMKVKDNVWFYTASEIYNLYAQFVKEQGYL